MNRLRVRMFRQGLGDCFLLTRGEDESATHVLIDCGVLKGTPDAAKRMTRVAESLHEATGGHIDVLVVTHQHWDHLSGFLQAKPVFETFTIGEVWLAWTEDPDDELATELRMRKQKRLQGLAAAAALANSGGTAVARRTAKQLDALLGFEGELGAAGDGRQTTEAALDWVKARDAEVRYLRPGDDFAGHAALPGIHVYVLGPPHDRRLIKRSDPSKAHPEVYELAAGSVVHDGFLAASEALANGKIPDAQPFDSFFRVDEGRAAEENALFRSYYRKADSWRRIEHDWLGYAGQLALQLDSDTNNTSLVLAFELEDSGKVLLFPGDAQVGNWLSWETLAWQFEAGTRARTVHTDDLLARTVLYKVGHHGSHNATLREKGLELMTSSELTAMIPVDRATAAKVEWLMPFPPLFSRLTEKTKGRVFLADAGLAEAAPKGLTSQDWNRFVGSSDVQEGWADFTLEW